MSRKRHFITNTLGLMLFVTIHVASIQYRNGAGGLIKTICLRLPCTNCSRPYHTMAASFSWPSSSTPEPLEREPVLDLEPGCPARQGVERLKHQDFEHHQGIKK
jgi:hypothetical protein